MSETSEVQANLFAEPRHVTNLDECFFYHAMDLPNYGSVDGYWDLRGNESQYLANVSLSGKRVLEIGPASGHLSFFMEREGANVVSVEAAENYQWEFFWDMQDRSPAELETKLKAHREMMGRLRNSYWLAHEAFHSKAQVHYGSGYSIPREFGLFDISVLGCVLLHNKNPIQILENCARVTKETLVVVEVFDEMQLAQTPIVFKPKESEQTWHTWWSFSPVYFVDVLRSMGFLETRVTFHQQICLGVPTGLFTVVGRRTPSYVVTESDSRVDVKLSSTVEALKIATDELLRIPISITNRGQAPISSSTERGVLLSYHWQDNLGENIVWDGLRTSLLRTLYENDHEDLLLSVLAPSQPGEYVLSITLLTEHVCWYDDLIPNLPLKIKTTVTQA